MAEQQQCPNELRPAQPMKRFLLITLMAITFLSPAIAAEPESYKVIYGMLFENENHVYSKQLTCPKEQVCSINEKSVHIEVRYFDKGYKVNEDAPKIVTFELTCATFLCAFSNGKTEFEVTEFERMIQINLQKGRPDLGSGGKLYLRKEIREPLAEFYVKIIK